MDFRALCSLLAGIATFFGFVCYTTSIVRGRSRPRASTWIVYGVFCTILIFSMCLRHAFNVQLFLGTIFTWVVVLLCAFKGDALRFTTLENWCFMLGIYGVAIASLFKTPEVSIVVSCAVLALASVPTFMSAWAHSSNESTAVWQLFTFACVLTLVSLPFWSIATVAQPLTFLAVDVAMLVILLRQKATILFRKCIREWVDDL